MALLAHKRPMGLQRASGHKSACPAFPVVHRPARASAPSERVALKATMDKTLSSATQVVPKAHEQKDLNFRHREVLKHFPTALGVDDFIARCEVLLSGYGFTGDNSIAMTNLCRDEITLVL
eukprot:CAMPEP_0202902042 /NCGR_PEP_ID=MMETSP1392-20130828/16012_1 /ASSEMBLY_ACC=CAM_ASM_000868 /TAXON_ID=225041 /ORGANISM="Chlamydomonas chlamydogama, Strain SAG 11-48b" /LENGTH=120 /DNA_ID=CAMNT_0049588723 /DNA_START=111 /DNA_END=469 /DNA_ORIENTATION=-